MSNEAHHHDSGYERLIMFTDGVFAIAITLLAIEIHVPEVENAAEIGPAILQTLPQILIYIISFMQVGLFWLAHHRMFRYIKRSDGPFMFMGVVYLMFVAFMPVPSATLGHFGPEVATVVFFGLIGFLVSAMEGIIWEYARTHHLLWEYATPHQIAEIRWRVINAMVGFGGSVPVAFIAPWLSIMMWLGTLVTALLVTRHFQGKARR